MPLPSIPEAAGQLKAFAERWAGNTANEKAAFQTWMIEFCAALGVDPPSVPTEAHRFELAIKVVDRDGNLATNYIDYWKAGHLALEAKAAHAGEKAEVRSGGEKPDLFLRRAFGQVRNYVAHVSGTPPPYLVVVDVPRTLIVWDRWTGQYGDFGAGKRMALATLHERPDDIALLQDILARPEVRDPRGRAQAVTRDIAAKLAELAAAFEDRGLEAEPVARFLMRCVFCFFAEDVGLLPRDLFKRTLETASKAGKPEHVGKVLTSLWTTMDQGGMFGAEMLHRFNGHFFQAVEALPLTAADVALLTEAAAFDWSAVEPSIFGTLLVRALDPEERHRLGAEYTPRAYIERLVEPTVVEPIRERWTAVQGAVVQLEQKGGKKDREAAVRQLLEFHAWLRKLRFLDPACGSGNFLYVTMAAVKRVELEVINEIERVSGKEQKEAILDEVHPRQFHGIEIKPWAREITELTLWIGYHQFWRESHGGRTPPDPILEDTGTIECRDAVLAWDEIVHRPEKDRPDPTPRIEHPVTGELVPDPARKLPYYEYVGARPAEWPQADFIVGNPPYIGATEMREALFDGYVEAIRAVYEEIPNGADFVMFWWARAAQAVASGRTHRAGLITTKAITQSRNRAIVEKWAKMGARVAWAVANHPWIGGPDSAAIRVAMTVTAYNPPQATLLTVDEEGQVLSARTASAMNTDLSVHADVAGAARIPLLSNAGLGSMGFALYGAGFIMDGEKAETLLRANPSWSSVLRPYLNGRDLAARARGAYVIDFGYMSEQEARRYAVLFDIVRDKVKPAREANARESIRTNWWRFGWPRREFREAVAGLTWYIATPETSKHRFFVLLPSLTAPDNKLVCIAVVDPFFLGVLSSRLHLEWAAAAGSRHGVGNDLVYNKRYCLDAFPFPDDPVAAQPRAAVTSIGIQLNEHRRAALARDERVTMTGMYNVVEKLRSGEKLTAKEKVIHEIAACGMLKDLHDELDRLVAEAYGWPWPMEKEEILERLVKLHDERVEEEKRGLIRWLRPEYQISRFAPEGAAAELDLPAEVAPIKAAPPVAKLPWPATAVEQLAAIGSVLSRGPATVAEALAAFEKGDRKLVERHLETLELLGEVAVDGAGRYGRVGRVG